MPSSPMLMALFSAIGNTCFSNKAKKWEGFDQKFFWSFQMTALVPVAVPRCFPLKAKKVNLNEFIWISGKNIGFGSHDNPP